MGVFLLTRLRDQLYFVVDKKLLDSQIFSEVPESILYNTEAKMYLCKGKTGGAALLPDGWVKVRQKEKCDFESSEIQDGMKTILLFWEVRLSGANEGKTRHVEKLDLHLLRDAMGQGVELSLPICNFWDSSGGLVA